MPRFLAASSHGGYAPPLECDGLAERFCGAVVIHGVTFAFSVGPVTALVGSNDSAKTTRLPALLALLNH